GGAGDAGAAHAEGVAEGDGAAVGIYEWGVFGDAEVAEDGDALAGEGFVELDDVEVGGCEVEAGTEFAGGGCGPHAHDARRDAGRGAAEDAGDGGETVLPGGGFGGDDESGGAVVDAGGVAGGDAAVGKERLQPGEGFDCGAGAGMLVGGDDDRVAFFLR